MITPVAPPAASPADPNSAVLAQPQSGAGADSSFAALLSGTAQSQNPAADSAPKPNTVAGGEGAKAAKPSAVKATAAQDKAEETSQVAPADAAVPQAAAVPAPALSAIMAQPDAAVPSADPVTPPEDTAQASAPPRAAPPDAAPTNFTPPNILADSTAATPPAQTAKAAAAPKNNTAAAPAKPAAKTENAAQTPETQGVPDAQAAATPAVAGTPATPPENTDAAVAGSANSQNMAAAQATGSAVPQSNVAALLETAVSPSAQNVFGASPKIDAGAKQSAKPANESLAQESADAVAANALDRGANHPVQNRNGVTIDTPKPEAGNAPPVQTAPDKAPADHNAAPAAQTQAAPAAPAASAASQAPANLGSLIAQTNPAPPSQTEAPVRLTVAPGPGAASDLEALAVRIARRSEGGESQFTIRLDPPSLGRIDVRLHVDAQGQAQAQLSADRPQTLQLLQRDAPALERALKDAGLDLGNGMSFSLNGDGRQAQERSADQGRGRYTRVAAVDDIEGIPPVLAARWSGHNFSDNTRVDITV